jgi:hypothetical protein
MRSGERNAQCERPGLVPGGGREFRDHFSVSDCNEPIVLIDEPADFHPMLEAALIAGVEGFKDETDMRMLPRESCRFNKCLHECTTLASGSFARLRNGRLAQTNLQIL